MLQVVFVKCHDQLLGSSLLALCGRIAIHMFKHPFPQAPHGPLYVRGHKDRWPVHTVIDNIMDHDIQAVLYGIPKYIRVFSRNIPLGNDLSADRVVDIMIDVCDFIGEPHDLSLHGRRISGRSVV